MKPTLLFFVLMAVLGAYSSADGADDHGPAAAGAPSSDQHHDEVKLTSDAIAKFGIKVGTAKEQTLTPTFAAPARVSFNAEAMAHVGAAVRGRATEIKARVG